MGHSRLKSQSLDAAENFKGAPMSIALFLFIWEIDNLWYFIWNDCFFFGTVRWSRALISGHIYTVCLWGNGRIHRWYRHEEPFLSPLSAVDPRGRGGSQDDHNTLLTHSLIISWPARSHSALFWITVVSSNHEFFKYVFTERMTHVLIILIWSII